ncbi:MAG: FkbM family methyltransferase [Bacteroidales bacterium]|nr:FkbM family methyltransferase [Bacteroidales bacterium]
MKRVLSDKSCCIDVGSHDGEMLDRMLSLAPEGVHFAFEPIPVLYASLHQQYGSRVQVYPYALSDVSGTNVFHYARKAPAYSGLKKRAYAVHEPDVVEIEVETRRLDALIPESVHIDFIKIDVEGAEFLVFRGAEKLLKRCKPVVVFEFGLGASDFYQTQPADIYHFLSDKAGLNISLLDDFLSGNEPLSLEQFAGNYHQKLEYYFVAHP